MQKTLQVTANKRVILVKLLIHMNVISWLTNVKCLFSNFVKVTLRRFQTMLHHDCLIVCSRIASAESGKPVAAFADMQAQAGNEQACSHGLCYDGAKENSLQNLTKNTRCSSAKCILT